MSFLDLVLQLRGLFAQRVRAMLTLLGIVIGSGSIVLLASLMKGGEQALISADQEATDEDLIAVSSSEVPPEQRERTRRELSRADGDGLAEAKLLAGASVQAETSRSTRAYVSGKKKRVALVSGNLGTLALYRLTIEQGRALDETDMAGRKRVCVIGHEVATELFVEPISALGEHMTIDDEVWTIVGVLHDKPMIGATDSTYVWNRKVVIPSSTWDGVLTGTHDVDRLYVRPRTETASASMNPLRSIITSTLLRRHLGVKNFKLEDPSNGGQAEMILTTIEALLLSTGFLALLASGINIMNVMLVTVSERTREIGIRRAVGATRRSILAQFVLEAATLSTIGGTLGVLAGLGVAWAAAALARMALGHFVFKIELWSIALGLAMSMLTGVAFGLFPAYRASRTSPIDALRAE